MQVVEQSAASLVVVHESDLNQFAEEYQHGEQDDQTSPVTTTSAPAIDPNDDSEYNLTDGSQILNDFNLEIGNKK